MWTEVNKSVHNPTADVRLLLAEDFWGSARCFDIFLPDSGVRFALLSSQAGLFPALNSVPQFCETFAPMHSMWKENVLFVHRERKKPIRSFAVKKDRQKGNNDCVWATEIGPFKSTQTASVQINSWTQIIFYVTFLKR